MTALAGPLEQRLEKLTLPLAVVLPGGQRIGSASAAVTVRLKELSPLSHIVTGQVGKIGEDYVEGRIDIDGSMRDLMALGAELMPGDPVDASAVGPTPLGWVRRLMHMARSRAHHQREADARQIQFHYDVSDDFYALWLDPKRVYSCAYFSDVGMSLEKAQEAKIEHICRKLMLKEGERFLDIGAGWGGLLLWAAEHYGVRARGITLSRNQHAYVNRLI
ncbi:MAG TPA: class I SAM-dependent methyltransferase, partial [Caldimonas sp.]|nr:class I SAM-dependent methyltransferase [Caldimonas sp.]